MHLNPAGQIEVDETDQTTIDEAIIDDQPPAENGDNDSPSVAKDVISTNGESAQLNGDHTTDEEHVEDDNEEARVIKVISHDTESPPPKVNESTAVVDETFISDLEESLIANGIQLANGHNDTKYNDFEQVDFANV